MFCIVDIESTGGKFEEEGIIEIALFKFNGHEVKDQLISLINPEGKEIQPYVSKLTGISTNMVKRAPKFYELAKRIVDLTKDNVLVAHNADFDYRMLQNEFNRLGFDFNMPTIDTITWAEKLIPDLPAYGLEKLCKSLGINHNSKHRAEGDALATLELFKLLLEKDTEKVLMSKAFHEEKSNHDFKHLIEPLKNVIGIYYLLNKKGKVIYVGRSNFLKNRIDRHFLANNTKALEMQEEIHDISIEETGNEVLSRIKEYVEFKKLKPKFNSRRFDFLLPYGVKKTEQGMAIEKAEEKGFIWYFQSKKEAHRACAHYCISNKIDPYKVFPAMSAKSISKLIESETEVVTPKKGFADLMYPSRDFILELQGKTPLEKCVILVKNNIPKGYAFVELKTQVTDVALIEKLISPFQRHTYIKSLVASAIQSKKYAEIHSY